MNHPLASALVATTFSALAVAQTLSSVVAIDRNLVYRQGALPLGTHSPSACDLRLAGAASTDHAFAHWWYYRVAGDPRESALQEDGNVIRAVLGNQIDCDWRNVSARGLLAAHQVTNVFGDGASGGVVVDRLTLTNISPSALVVDAFAYTDFDICGSFLGDSASGDSFGHVVTDASTCGSRISFRADGNDISEVTDFNPTYPAVSIRSRLTDNAVDDLHPWAGNFGPGDYTAAFQWRTRTLAPHESMTFQCWFEGNLTMSCIPRAAARGIAIPGSSTAPILDASASVITPGSGSRALTASLRSAPAGRDSLLVLGFAAASIPLPGLVVYVDPTGWLAIPRLVGPSGAVSYDIPVVDDISLCGAELFMQWFVVDPTAPSGFVSQTTAVDVRLGGL
ncbi:MAG: hypothetical protein U1F36_13815 [Planctomycetota bacterium]